MNAASLIARKGRDLIRRRFYDGTYVDGAYTEDRAAVDQPIVGAVQPMGVREKLLLPEGDRVREWIKVWTCDDVRTSQGLAAADQLIVDGKTYEVQQVADWTLPGRGARLTHREVNAVSVNTDRAGE